MTDHLPFSEQKQDALLGYLLTEEKFFRQGKGKIKSDWFLDAYSSKVWTAKVKFFEKYGRSPTIVELKDFSFDSDEQTRQKILAKIDQALDATHEFKLDSLADELTNWMHARIYWDGVTRSKDLFNGQRFEQAYLILKGLSKEIDNTSFVNDNEVSFENFSEYLEKAQDERKHALTFGSSMLDRLLLPEAEFGSLLPGDTTVIVAPTNTGKTTTVISVICHNIRKGKSALFIVHEGTKEDIRMKILCNILKASKAEVLEMYASEEGFRKINMAVELIKRFLTFVHHPKAGATIEEVEAIVRRKQDERIAKYGKPYDLVVDDYPAKLITSLAKGGQFSKRHIDDISYGYFVQLALEYGSHCLLPVQTNRTGSKINKNVDVEERRLLTGEDVQESFGVIQQATNVITLNRDPLAESMGFITFYLDKSRSSEKGFAVVCKTEYGKATTHSDELGSIWYRGMDTITSKSNFKAVFERYKNSAVPDYELIGD
jgi:replicative DNA helicase